VATKRFLDGQLKKMHGGHHASFGHAIKENIWRQPNVFWISNQKNRLAVAKYFFDRKSNKASSSHQTFFGQASKEIT